MLRDPLFWVFAAGALMWGAVILGGILCFTDPESAQIAIDDIDRPKNGDW